MLFLQTRIIILFSMILLFYNVVGAGNPPLELTKIQAPLVFDGMPDELFWDNIQPVPLTMHLPTYGKKPTEKSEIRIAYDDDYLYLSGRLYDSEPDKIAANSKKRDAFIGNTDWFGFVIDSYNDKENGLAFFTNPNGLRLDVNVFGDALGRNPVNLSWNTFWDVKTVINEEGWFAELRIPFSSLQFQSGEEVKMGISTWRYIARKNESAIFPAISPEWGDWSMWRPSLAQEYILRGVKRQKPFYVTPYALGSFNEQNNLDDLETSYTQEEDRNLELGLDVKYGLSKNFTLDLTVNTDFAQVEVDDQQVNLTRFSLFFPEKRLFFQERSGVFQYSFGSRDQLFYSRRIGIDDDGNPVRILGGARLVGRAGLWDIGMMNMQTQGNDNLNGENFTVLRLRREVFNPNSDAGFIFTNRMDFEGNYNTVYGFDATIRVVKDDFLSLRWASSFDSENSDQFFSLDPTRFWISWATRRFKGLTYAASFSRAGKNYDPGVGFQGRKDFTRVGMRLSHGWFGKEESWLQRYNLIYRAQMFWSNQESGLLETYSGSAAFEFNAKKGWGGAIGTRYNYEFLDEELEFTDEIFVDQGLYRFFQPYINFTTSPNASFFVGGEISYGDFYGGKRMNVSLNPNWALSASWELSGNYQFNRIDFPLNGGKFDIHVGGLRVLYMLDTKFSVSSFIQYNSASGTFLTNLRLRYNPKEGNDLFIVFNDDMNTNRFRELPILPVHNTRNVVVKYSYTFSL